MDKNESYPDFVPESGDSDDVEILEVVGVEGEAERVADPPPPPPEEADDRPNEYLLDFDDPEQGMLAERPATETADEEKADGSDGETDHQRLLRVRADYDNLRKRIDREREEFEVYANYALVGRLLPVVDNLERALAADTGNNGVDDSLREGLAMIHRQLMDQLRQEGLCRIEAVGQPFDPNLHDAVETEVDCDARPNTVIEELQKGYLFQDRVLRPAMVRVSTPTDDLEEGE